VNCYRIHQKSLNFIYPFKLYSNFTNKNVTWLHFSWATQYMFVLTQSSASRCNWHTNAFTEHFHNSWSADFQITFVMKI